MAEKLPTPAQNTFDRLFDSFCLPDTIKWGENAVATQQWVHKVFGPKEGLGHILRFSLPLRKRFIDLERTGWSPEGRHLSIRLRSPSENNGYSQPLMDLTMDRPTYDSPDCISVQVELSQFFDKGDRRFIDGLGLGWAVQSNKSYAVNHEQAGGTNGLALRLSRLALATATPDFLS